MNHVWLTLFFLRHTFPKAAAPAAPSCQRTRHPASRKVPRGLINWLDTLQETNRLWRIHHLLMSKQENPWIFQSYFAGWMVYDDQFVIFLMIEHTLDLRDFKALGNTIWCSLMVILGVSKYFPAGDATSNPHFGRSNKKWHFMTSPSNPQNQSSSWDGISLIFVDNTIPFWGTQSDMTNHLANMPQVYRTQVRRRLPGAGKCRRLAAERSERSPWHSGKQSPEYDRKTGTHVKLL